MGGDPPEYTRQLGDERDSQGLLSPHQTLDETPKRARGQHLNKKVAKEERNHGNTTYHARMQGGKLTRHNPQMMDYRK